MGNTRKLKAAGSAKNIYQARLAKQEANLYAGPGSTMPGLSNQSQRDANARRRNCEAMELSNRRAQALLGVAREESREAQAGQQAAEKELEDEKKIGA